MTTVKSKIGVEFAKKQWVSIGAVTAVASVLAVLIVQALAIAIWPDIALFKPLDSYVRSAIFTLVPAVGATALFAWLASRKARPVQAFLKISAFILLLSIIPDYLIPVPHKTLLASSVTAGLHVVAASVTVSVLVIGYRQRTK